MADTKTLQRLFTSYGNAMYRNDTDAAELIAQEFSASLAAQAQGEPIPGAVFEDGGVTLVRRGTEDERCRTRGSLRIYTAPPPAAQPVRQPLTDEHIADLFEKAGGDLIPTLAGAFKAGVKLAERAHDITGEPAAQPVAALKSFLACEIECSVYECTVLPAIERWEQARPL